MPVTSAAEASAITIVVWRQVSVPSASGAFLGKRKARPATRSITGAADTPTSSNDFAHGVGSDRERDFARSRRASRQRFRQVGRLLERYLRRHRRLMRVDHRLYQHWSRRRQSLSEHLAAF